MVGLAAELLDRLAGPVRFWASTCQGGDQSNHVRTSTQPDRASRKPTDGHRSGLAATSSPEPQRSHRHSGNNRPQRNHVQRGQSFTADLSAAPPTS